jgi:hypothetical protein
LIPPAHVDPGGKRKWWTDFEARVTLQKLNDAAQPVPHQEAA